MILRTAMILALALAPAALAKESHRVSGHVRKDGTYVAPHRATNPDSSKANNWSSKPNANPYTGKSGSVDPYKPSAPKAPKAPTF